MWCRYSLRPCLFHLSSFLSFSPYFTFIILYLCVLFFFLSPCWLCGSAEGWGSEWKHLLSSLFHFYSVLLFFRPRSFLPNAPDALKFPLCIYSIPLSLFVYHVIYLLTFSLLAPHLFFFILLSLLFYLYAVVSSLPLVLLKLLLSPFLLFGFVLFLKLYPKQAKCYIILCYYIRCNSSNVWILIALFNVSLKCHIYT